MNVTIYNKFLIIQFTLVLSVFSLLLLRYLCLLQTKLTHNIIFLRNPGREGALDCKIYQYPKFLNMLLSIVRLKPAYTNNEINSGKNHETYTCISVVVGGQHIVKLTTSPLALQILIQIFFLLVIPCTWFKCLLEYYVMFQINIKMLPCLN